MTNSDVLSLFNNGILDITSYSLDAKGSYSVMKFRNAIKKQLNTIVELENGILKELGVKDAANINNRIKELEAKDKTPEELEEYNNLQEQAKKFNSTRGEMLAEKVKITGFTLLNYEQWYNLRKENHPQDSSNPDPLNNYVEDILDGILWKADE